MLKKLFLVPLAQLICLLLITWAGLTIQINTAWFGHHDGNGAWISAAVRAYQYHGLTATRLVPSTNYDTAGELRFYTHHPPLIVWLSGIAAAAFGLNEMALRFVVASLTLISVAAFYVLARRLLDPHRGLIAAGLYVLMPMTLYFGRMPNHEPLALVVGMCFAAILVNWLRQPTRLRWIALAGLAISAAWSIWGAVMLVGCLLLAGLILGNGRQRRDLIIIGLLMAGSTAAFLLYYELVVPGSFAELIDSFFFRSGNTIGYGVVRSFGWGEFFSQQVIDLLLNLTPGALLIGIIGLIITLRTQPYRTKVIAGMLWVMAVGYILILKNAALEHDFYKFYFVPPVALTGAVAAEKAWRSRWRPLLTAVMLVSLLGGFAYVGYLHRIVHQSRQPVILRSIQTYAQPQDELMTNVNIVALGMLYYLNRPLITNVQPDEVVAMSHPVPVLYIYCSSDPLSPELAAYPYQTDDYCAYIHLPATSPE